MGISRDLVLAFTSDTYNAFRCFLEMLLESLGEAHTYGELARGHFAFLQVGYRCVLQVCRGYRPPKWIFGVDVTWAIRSKL